MHERAPERKNIDVQLEVIAGSMFSGKTDELIRRLVREEIAKVEVQLFKPSIDIRYDPKKVNSHSGSSHEAILIENGNPRSILELVKPTTRVIGIDEVQFFSPEIVDVCEELVAKGKRVIVAGLPLNFRGEPFGSMPLLMVRAEKVDRLAAVCMICGGAAHYTQRLMNGLPAEYDSPEVQIGGLEAYEPRCRKHHEVPGKPSSKKNVS